MFKLRVNDGFFLCLMLAAFCLLPISSLFAQEKAFQGGQGVAAQASADLTPGRLTPAQRQAVQSELSKTGGQLTPDAIEALKKSPEFKDIKPEEIQKGMELLKKKEAERGGEKKVDEMPKETAKPAASAEGEVSLFDRYISDTSPLEVSTRLKPFGYDLFTGAVLTPPQDLPVASDYIIGPGDEVNILLWGRMAGQYNLTVSRDGTIQFPNKGALSVAGMTFEEMKRFLIRQTKSIVGAEINVTMGRLRSIQVFVLGEVKKPGAYTVSAMSTITNALIASGGPTQIGTLRKVELKRANSNKVAAAMDFYELLLKGDKSNDLRLQNGDVIFVPTIGPIVGVAGNVKRPAIYELKDETDLAGILELAGGIIPTAYTQQIQVERVDKNVRRIIVDLNTMENDIAKTFKLQDADLVKVFTIVDRDINAVYLYGNLKRPGKYEYKIGMRVNDLIKDSTELLKETHFEYALIKRLNPPGLETQLIPFNLGKVLFNDDTVNNIELRPQDSIYIFSRWFFKDKPFITLEGEVRRGGRFSLNENTMVKDAILLAGGLTKNAYLQRGEIIRLNEKKEESQVFFNVGLAMTEDPKENILLQDEDRIFVRKAPDQQRERIVSITGEVNFPGRYVVRKGEKLSSLIERAGGFTDKAYLKAAVFTRESVKELQQKNLNESIDRLEQQMLSQSAASIETAVTPEAAKQQEASAAMQKAIIAKMRAAKAQGRMVIRFDALDKFKGSVYDIETEEGDSIHIPEQPNSVQVIGSVYNPTAFVFEPERTISGYINKAGGTTRYAENSDIFVLKVDGSTAARRQSGMLFMSSSLDPGDTIVVPEKTERIAWLREIKDLTQILYQIAVTAGVLIVLF